MNSFSQLCLSDKSLVMHGPIHLSKLQTLKLFRKKIKL